MIFQKFKEDVVVEKGWATIKEIKNMACRLGLLTIFLALGLGLITYSTVGFPVTLIVLILLGMGYVWMFDMADETEETTVTAGFMWHKIERTSFDNELNLSFQF